MDNIEFSDFQNICRCCMHNSDLISIQNNNIIDVLEYLSNSKYSKSDGLPQKLCIKCIETMNEIQSFAFKCKQTHLNLTKCLTEFKNNQNSQLLENATIYTVDIESIINKVVAQKGEVDTNNLELVTEHLIKEEQIVTKEDVEKRTFLTNYPNNEITSIKLENIDVKEEIEDDSLELITEYLVKDELLFQEMVTEEELENQDTNSTVTNTNQQNCLLTDKKTHNSDRTFRCDVCMKEFKQLYSLSRHKRMHNGDPTYQCEICNKKFTTKSYLLRHRIVHTEERRIECNICMKDFKKYSYLLRHKRIHSDLRPFQCEVCNKSFSQKSILINHKTTHTDERRFKCNVCLKDFKHLESLNRHKKVHSVKHPFKCGLCDKTFKLQYHLDEHVARHNNESFDFECDVCMKGFKYSNNLIRHKLYECV